MIDADSVEADKILETFKGKVLKSIDFEYRYLSVYINFSDGSKLTLNISHPQDDIVPVSITIPE